MTTKQTAKLTALRAEADLHGDVATVALVDAAIAGDVEAAAKLGIAAQAVKAAVSTGAGARGPRIRRPSPGITAPAHPSHPWAHDEE